MADDQAQIKTEQPTVRRREESREQGRVAFSNELNSGILLFIGAMLMWFGGETLGGGLQRGFQQQLRSISPNFDQTALNAQLMGIIVYMVGMTAFFFLTLFAAGFLISVLQAGVYVAPAALTPNWSRVSPFEGWERIFSGAGVMRGVMALLKATFIILLTGWVLWSKRVEIASLAEGTLSEGAHQVWNIAALVLIGVSAGMVLIGLGDYLFQRNRHDQQLMMSRQELKEELKRDEGDPQIRARRRMMAREIAARERMIAEVPKATVVITNPEHVAVALQYEQGAMSTPKVIAKGGDHVAGRIIKLARRHGVPVVERKLVARAIFAAVNVGDEIPVALYYAVSEVLSYVYRLRGESGVESQEARVQS